MTVVPFRRGAKQPNDASAAAADARPYWFWLDWYQRVVEPDPNAPRPEPGETMPTRARRQHYARRVEAATAAQANAIRTWHTQHDTWVPADALLDDAGHAPDVSDVQTRNH